MTEKLRAIAESSWFQTAIIVVILLAGVLVGVETNREFHHQHQALLDTLDRIILGIFVAEIVIKVGAEGSKPWRYFLDPWNIFDFIIVAACFLPFEGNAVTVLRLLRLLRVLKLVRVLPQLQLLVSALLKSVPSMAYVGMLLLILFYVYAVAGVFLFGVNDPTHFRSLPIAMLTLFRVVTLEGWTEILYINLYGCDQWGDMAGTPACTEPLAQPTAAVAYFISFVLIGTMVILNLFIGVIMNSMEEAQMEALRERDRELEAAGKLPTIDAELDALEESLQEIQKQLETVHRHIRDQRVRQGTRS
jgi:voltage-gated sodium channel